VPSESGAIGPYQFTTDNTYVPFAPFSMEVAEVGDGVGGGASHSSRP
jgi:hypothetical protein